MGCLISKGLCALLGGVSDLPRLGEQITQEKALRWGGAGIAGLSLTVPGDGCDSPLTSAGSHTHHELSGVAFVGSGSRHGD